MILVKKLLHKGRSVWQMAGASLAAVIGLFLLFFALQVWLDLQALNQRKGTDGNASQYLLLNKKVGMLSMLSGSKGFTEEELEDLKLQSWCKGIGSFQPNSYKVSASSKTLGFYTDLFFEAVPDDFLDKAPPAWHWTPGQEELPIMMSRDYLALYNFGFAPSQGLPQFSASAIGKVTVDIQVSGNGSTKVFQGRIVGFSDRINSILVPASFQRWANETYGDPVSSKGVSRVLVRCTNPQDQELRAYLQLKGYEVSNGRLIGGETLILLQLLLTIIAGIGILILVLSALVFLLHYEIIIARASRQITLLLQLGYRYGTIAQLLKNSLSKLLVFSWLVAIALLAFLHYFAARWLVQQGFELSPWPHLAVWAVAGSVLGIMLLLSFARIQRQVKALF